MEPTLDKYESTRQPQYSEGGSLPPRLQRMITEKRQLRKLWERTRDPKLKNQLNALCVRLKTELKEYRETPEMWFRLHPQRHVSPPPTNQAASIPNAKYPTIVVETFPNVAQHLLNLRKECVNFNAICRHNRILFISPSGSEYHAVVKFMKSIEATEPDLKYAINPLHVCIRGIPDCLLIEEVEGAITERGYVVGQIKQINWNVCYVKICGGKDNTKILEMRELLGLKVKVELWKSGPVKREMENTALNEPVTSTSSAAMSGVPSLRPEHQPAQSNENQAVESGPSSTAKYPDIVVESFPNLSRHLLNLRKECVSFKAICRHSRILFISPSGSEYHAVVKFMKSIEATEPDLKYAINPLHVCIRGIPDCLLIEEVEGAITERGYVVGQIKQISWNLCYVKICGGKDNTKILEMRELLGLKVKVELWKSGPVKREMEHTELNEPVTSTSRAATSGAPPATLPSLRSEHQPERSTENQAVEREPSSIAKYPAIVVESFPNWPRHLGNIANELGRTACSEAWYQGIRFVPRDGPEYHAVIKYLKSIEVTEPGLKYVVRSLDVCIHGLPSNIPTDAVKAACTDRGYLVDHVKLISIDSRYGGGLYYLKICGRKDNTKILEMRDLLGYWINVELWRGGPVKKEKNPITSAPSNITALAPMVPPLRSEYLSSPAPQFAGSLAPAPTAPLLRPQQPVLAGPSGNQAQAIAPIVAAPPRLPAITPEQMAALTAQITALTLTVFQIFGQRDHNQ